MMEAPPSPEPTGFLSSGYSILTFVLTVLGAIGGVVLFRNWLRGLYRTFRQRFGLWRDVPNDYYFRSVDLACRVVAPTHFMCFRTGEIVSLRNNLTGFSVGIGPSKDIDITIQSLDGHALSEIEDVGPWRTRKSTLISFGRALQKGESMRFKLAMSGQSKTNQAIDRHWLWVNEHRVDELILRVIFVDEVPEKAFFQMIDHEGTIHLKEELPIDRANMEVRQHLKWPRPSRVYMLKW